MSDGNEALRAFRSRLHTAGLDAKNSPMRESSRHSDALRLSELFQPPDADADVETAADAEAEEEEEAIHVTRRRSSRHLRSVDSELLDDMKEQLRILKAQNDELLDKVDDYEAVGEEIFGKKVGVERLCQYIGEMQQKEEKFDQVKEENDKLHSQLAKVQKEFDEQKEAFNSLLASVKENGSREGAEQAKTIEDLQRKLREREAEVTSLKQKLAAANATAATTLNRIIEGGGEKGLDLDDADLMAMAEKELKLMEALISEQECYIQELEEELNQPSTAQTESLLAKDEHQSQEAHRNTEGDSPKLLDVTETNPL